MSLTLIRKSTVLDGSGAPPFTGDAAFENGIIRAVGGNLDVTGADTVIDGDHLCLAPGFIDPHTHSDISVLAAPEATGKISQGVTTDIVGNCGLSVFPVSNRNREHLNSLYERYNLKITWDGIDGYAAEIDRCRPAVNIASLCGHNTLRASVCGYGNRVPDPEECREIRRRLQDSLKCGAAGLSTGLLYVPGKFASSAELRELLEELSRFNRPYATHLRSEGRELEEAIREAVELCILSGQHSLHISHLKTSGSANWHKLASVLEIISGARECGLIITADRYPYTESMTQLSIILPSPYDDLEDRTLEEYLSDPVRFTEIQGRLAELPETRWDTVRLVSTEHPEYSRFSGELFSRIAVLSGLPPSRICAEILRSDAVNSMAAFMGMSPANLAVILGLDYVCCGSDESARPVYYDYGRSHPRGLGSFPRFINRLKDEVPLEKTIRKLTGLPAEIFSLPKKGRIRTGFDADLVLFNPEKLNDRADFRNPHRLAEGIERVWVNGEPAYSPGKTIASRHGRFIRPYGRTAE